MGKAGRPSKKDMPTGETYSQKLLSAIEAGMSDKTAAELCGISESTVTEWKAKDPDFRRAVLEARAKGVEWWVSKLKGHADKQVGAVMFWLSRRSPEFREEQVAVPPGKKLTIEITDAK